MQDLVELMEKLPQDWPNPRGAQGDTDRSRGNHSEAPSYEYEGGVGDTAVGPGPYQKTASTASLDPEADGAAPEEDA